MITTAALCLAMNIYHEARGEPLAGQLAVGYSVMNRVADERYPNTICEVVHQARYNAWDMNNPIKHKCQYSWFCDGLPDTPNDSRAMLESIVLSKKIINGTATDISEGATHYHAHYVDPYWAVHMEPVLEVGDHLFYR
tara:strand:+ start:132 stop:545 length:414 start_codon:yes stop_codon:yes gene_type:complete